MILIAARSPYQVVIDEADQVATKVELYLWNKDVLPPPHPTYIMSEKIASVTQRETNYNISPFVLEKISQIQNDYTSDTVSIESDSNWCYVRIIKYYSTDGVTFDLLTDKSYIGVNAYTLVEDGVNYDYCNDDVAILLAEKKITVQYQATRYYYNFMCERSASLSYVVNYLKNNVIVNTQTFLTAGASEIFNYKIPLAVNESDTTEIKLGTTLISKFQTELILECKYEPVLVSFVNRYGGWQPLTFFKASENSIDTKGTEYNLMPESWNYNYQVGQTKTMNINGSKMIKCNTGFVDEDYSELITDLLMSDTILVNFLPATVKSKSTVLKKHLKEKNINYTIEFEYSNNLLNNVV